MGECPFCGSQVDEDLITFGGPCPKCFADIPGEEAATDPGEDVKAAQARKDQMRSTLRTVLPFLLLVPVLGVLALAALWFGVLRPEPEVVLLDFDESDEYPMPELVAAPPAEAEQDDAVADAGKGHSEGSSTAGIGQGGTELQGDAPVGEEQPMGTRKGGAGSASGPSRVDEVGEAGGAGGGLDLSLDVSTARRGEVLSDPTAIKEMIGQRMAAQAPRLNSCYEKQLKTDENLAGRWRLAFVVGEDGKTSEARAEALSGSVPAFETCLAEELSRWSFQRISRDQPVRKTFTFRPAY